MLIAATSPQMERCDWLQDHRGGDPYINCILSQSTCATHLPVKTDIMPSAEAAPTIDRLLNLVPDSPAVVLAHLESHPSLAGAQDSHGYSLLHAAASYSQIDLLRTLVNDKHASVNIVDEDQETPLFYAETVEIAQVLIELGANTSMRNEEGQTPLEKFESEGENQVVADFLRVHSEQAGDSAAGSVLPSDAPANGEASANGVHPPPPLPPNVSVEVGTMSEDTLPEAPDPEFRRRIEELASREDFQGEEGQRELRSLVSEAVAGLRDDEIQEAGRITQRRRVG